MTSERSGAEIDELIRDLVRTGRSATAAEVERIFERMVAAPFDPRMVRVRVEERGASYLGHTLGRDAESLTYHLVKRVALEEQWIPGTTAEQYLRDLRRAVRDPSARLAVYERRGGYLTATLTPTAYVVRVDRRGVDAMPLVLVVYSADRGIIITGYQIAGLETAGIPREARWLR